MRDDLKWKDDFAVIAERSAARCQPILVLFAAGLTAIASAAVCVAAVIDRAPAAALPLVVMICVGCPLFAGREVPAAVASLRVERARGNAVAKLRDTLAQLPEVEHPLGY